MNLTTAISLISNSPNHLSFDELKTAYKRAVLLAHPDKGGTHESMTELNKAWSTILRHKDTLSNACNTGLSSNVDEWKLDPLHVNDIPSFKSKETLVSDGWNIMNNVDDMKTEDGRSDEWGFCSPHNSFFFQQERLYYSYWQNGGATLQDLTNALKGRKTCREYRLSYGGNYLTWHEDFYNLCEQLSVSNVLELWNALESMDDWTVEQYNTHKAFNCVHTDIKIYKYDTNSSKEFSPFNIDVIKPLTQMPSKWTVTHLKKVIANGQFSHLKQDFYYTDDYLMDSATNFRKGYIPNPLEMLAKDFDRSLRVWSNERNGVVTLHFGNHSNDGRSLVVNLNNRYPLVDMSDIESALCENKPVLLH